MRKRKICVVIGTAMVLNSLYKGQFKFLMDNGFEITGLAPKGIEHEWLRNDGIKTKVILLKRLPSVFHDTLSVVQLTWFFLFNRFDIISISTPKAALVGAIASFITFHKNVIYTQRGRVYENTTGFKRFFYESIERFIFKVSKKIFCISHELKDEFVLKKYCSPNKIFVINSGSSNGVDLQIFTKNPVNIKEGSSIREKFGLKPEDILILYSGRLRKDKGINELVYAFLDLTKSYSNLYLLLQGRFEEIDPINSDVKREIENNRKVFTEPWSKLIDKYLAAADIFAFPSHREGFGNVAIEASAMELPVVGFNVTGCRESINNGISGILVEPISSNSLKNGLEQLIINPDLRKKLGENGRKWVEKEFDSKIIWDELLKVYNEMTKSTT